MLQDNGREFTTSMASRCMQTGAATLAAGPYMTPLRMVSIRLLHKFNKTTNKECLHENCG